MQLWSGILSNNAAKVRIALAEKGLTCEINEIPWSREKRWEPKPDAFLQLSPRGQVPVLVDDEVVLHDSTVIVEYLEDKYPEPPLFPSRPVDKAYCRLWEDEADFVINQFVVVLITEVFMKGEQANVDLVTEAKLGIDKFLGRLDQQLAGKEYICSDFTAADISNFMVVAFSTTMGVSLTQNNVIGWFERMLARPTIKFEYEQILKRAAAV